MQKKRFLMGAGILLASMSTTVPASAAGTGTWAGLYAGINAGYGWGGADTTVSSLPAGNPGGMKTTNVGVKPAGGVAGAQVGYNWQSGNTVYGLETDGSWSGMKKTTVLSPVLAPNGAPIPGGSISVQQKITSLGTLRARLGQDLGNNVLIFGTGGFAWGNVKTNANVIFPAVRYPVSQSKIKVGWTVGAGVEWAFNATTSFKVEYLHVNLGKETAVGNPVPANPPWQTRYDWKTSANIVRGGLNFYF